MNALDPAFADALARARAGDRGAMERLLLPHLGMLHAYSQALCGDFHGAQDVVQETAVIAFTNIDKFFPESDFATWLRGIARRQALAHARAARRYLPAADEAFESAFEDEESGAERHEGERAALAQCLDALEKRARAVVVGHYLQGLALAELAQRQQTKVGTLKSILFHVRRHLLECVRRRLDGVQP